MIFRINQADIPNEITVRAGQTLKLAVPYAGGHPPPTAKWTNDDEPVDEKRAVIEVKSPLSLNIFIHESVYAIQSMVKIQVSTAFDVYNSGELLAGCF